MWIGYEWTRSPSLGSIHDTTSPVYPNRPIRPLPKRRIRSRISDDQAKNIIYPTPPNTSSPLFGFPHSGSSPRSDQPVLPQTARATSHATQNNQNWSELASDDELEGERHWSREHAAVTASGKRDRVEMGLLIEQRH
jgi:hypothetical protein